jgi:hypothetical protein
MENVIFLRLKGCLTGKMRAAVILEGCGQEGASAVDHRLSQQTCRVLGTSPQVPSMWATVPIP